MGIPIPSGREEMDSAKSFALTVNETALKPNNGPMDRAENNLGSASMA